MNYSAAPHTEPPKGGTPNGMGASPRIPEVGDGFHVTPVPEPTEAELAVVCKALDEGRGTRLITVTAEDEAQIQIWGHQTGPVLRDPCRRGRPGAPNLPVMGFVTGRFVGLRFATSAALSQVAATRAYFLVAAFGRTPVTSLRARAVWTPLPIQSAALFRDAATGGGGRLAHGARSEFSWWVIGSCAVHKRN